jgi:ArsR family transcriptional regulator
MENKLRTDLAEIFFAISDVNRLKIIEMLAKSEMNCSELKNRLEVSLPTVTHHLDILIRAGIVEKRRDGVWKYGVLHPETIKEAFKNLLAEI